jgi:hypothetical protein
VVFTTGAPVGVGAAVDLVVYDSRGRVVARMPFPAGATEVAWAPERAASGVYLARLEAEGDGVVASASFTRLR